MKPFELKDSQGNIVALIMCEGVYPMNEGIDTQPNIFNRYVAVEIGEGHHPAVLNIPAGFTLAEKTNNQ